MPGVKSWTYQDEQEFFLNLTDLSLYVFMCQNRAEQNTKSIKSQSHLGAISDSTNLRNKLNRGKKFFTTRYVATRHRNLKTNNFA